MQPNIKPKTRGPSMQTNRYSSICWRNSRPTAMMVVLIVMICTLLVMEHVTKKIQTARETVLLIQKYMLYIADYQTVAMPALMEQVGSQLAKPISWMGNIIRIMQIRNQLFLLKSSRLSLAVQWLSWMHGRLYLSSRGIVIAEKRPRAVQVDSQSHIVSRGDRAAPMLKVTAKKSNQNQGLLPLNKATTIVKESTLIAIRQNPETNNMTVRLTVLMLILQSTMAKENTMELTRQICCAEQMCARYLVAKLPAVQATDRTMKMKEQCVQSRPESWLQKGMRTPQELRYQPVMKLLKRRMEYTLKCSSIVVYSPTRNQQIVTIRIYTEQFYNISI